MLKWLRSIIGPEPEKSRPPEAEDAIEKGQAIVLELLHQLELNPVECQVQPFEWVINKGNATVYVSIQKDYDPPQLLIYSPLLILPEDNILPLYRHLLEFNNFDFSGPAKFSVREDWIILSRFTRLEGLTVPSALEILVHLADLADEQTQALQAEFAPNQQSPDFPPVYDQ